MPSTADNSSALKLLLDLGQAFHATLELDPLLVTILTHMQAAAQSETAAIWLLDDEARELRCSHAVGPQAEAQVGQRVRPPSLEWLLSIDWAARLAGPEAAGAETPDLRSALAGPTGCEAILAPLVARGQPLGLLVAANKPGGATFSQDERALIGALAGHAAVAIQNAQLFEQERQHAERQRLLEHIGRHLQQTLDSEVLIPLILEEVNKAIDAEGQSLWLLEAESGCIVCRYATGQGAEAIKKVSVPMGMGIVGRSVDQQEAIRLADAQDDPRVYRGADAQTGFSTHTLLCVPLVRQGKAIGAIEAVNKRTGGPFTTTDLELLRNIADSAALAIENARLYADLAVSYDSTLDALAAALDLRDRETAGHSRRVVEYTARLARQMGLDETQISDICRGALLHDVGKIGVPDSILHKPGALTPDERAMIEKHPQAGYEMLLDIPYLKEEIEIVLSHQESWDGSGYPFGLRGEEIPLGARLFALADTYDALTSDRPYRRGGSYVQAIRVIAKEAGRQFDPKVVAAFLAIPPAELEAIRARVLQETDARLTRQQQRRLQAHSARLAVSLPVSSRRLLP